MGVLDFMRRRSDGRRVVYVRNITAGYISGLGAAQMYREQPALRSVVSFIADNIAQLPLKVYTRAGDNDRQRDTQSAAALLLARPSATATTYETVRALVSDIELYGYALLYVTRDADAPAGWQAVNIPAAWVCDRETVDGFTVSRWQVSNPATSAGPVWLDAANVVVFGSYDPAGPIASSSPIEALKQVLSEQVSAWAFRNAVWKNGGWVSSYLTRPANAADWSPEARDRFATSWRERFAGEGGTNTGGTPLLEDGMELKQATLNAREAQWREATILAREDVAAVYHINPSIIWHTDGQTYASAKDNARALYADALAPVLVMMQQVFNARLLPMLGADDATYCEFDLQAKLAGSFEEQASVIQSMVGAPVMTRNEGRARFNLPAVDDGDELITPLNVLVGGLASPNDTDPTIERYNAGEVERKAAPIKARGYPDTADAKEIAETIAAFARRQSKRVLQDIGKAQKAGTVAAKADGDAPEWWDGERWDKELADDLTPVFQAIATKRGRAAMRKLGLDPDNFDEKRIKNYIRAMSEGKTRAVNTVTLRELEKALAGDYSEEAEGHTPEGVFSKAENDRAEMEGVSFATAVAGWALLEACRQHPARASQKQKTWIVTSSNPRTSHLLMNGETVQYNQPFSNGAMYPGDRDLVPAESCGCQCQIELTISW